MGVYIRAQLVPSSFGGKSSQQRAKIHFRKTTLMLVPIDEVAGDIGATWRTAQSLLHNNHKVVYSDAECASLVSTFCQFFVDKVHRIRDSIAVKLQSTVRRLFTARPYLGLTLSSFRPVTTEEVRRLLSAMPSKSSPLDVLPCSLLKSCSDVFAPVIAKLANLSMQTVKFPASYKQAQVMPLLNKAGLLP